MSSRFTNPSDSSAGSASSGENGGPRSAFAPVVSLLKGGGAITGMSEKFGVNPATGTGTLTIPIATSLGRAGFGVQLLTSSLKN